MEKGKLSPHDVSTPAPVLVYSLASLLGAHCAPGLLNGPRETKDSGQGWQARALSCGCPTGTAPTPLGEVPLLPRSQWAASHSCTVVDEVERGKWAHSHQGGRARWEFNPACTFPPSTAA